MLSTCAVTAFAGAEIMYKSDYDVHNAVFVDHLNTSPNYVRVILIGITVKQAIVVL